MNYYHVCPIGVIAGRQDLLTYQSEDALVVGRVIEIPFGRRTKLGLVIEPAPKPSFTTKAISRQLEEVVPEHLIKLGFWMSDYYGVRVSLVFQAILPRGLGKARRQKERSKNNAQRAVSDKPLNQEQKDAVRAISTSKEITHLLFGVTGSGKTRVYQELAKQTLLRKQSVVVLVPEISLTPQLAAEFEHIDQNVLILHSRLTEAERHKNWRLLEETSEPWIVVGPRSALFSPLKNIGLIIVDECHEPSYQQDSQPKYSALRVARKLAELSPVSPPAKLVLASATPLVSDYFVASETKTPIHKLTKPATVRNTTVEIVDMREKNEFGTHQLFSKKLLDAMNKSIAQNEQILLFHNRRGTARMSLCSSCGWVAECRNCHIPMRLHHDHAELRCHVCGRSEQLVQICPICKNPDIDFRGFGSKRIEAEVRKLFSDDVCIARFDSDTPLQEQLHNRYQELYEGKIQIIIGTQGLAKGLDLPHLNTVGIVQADSELFIPDYSSNERSFQLTTQVIGRAGRTGAKSQVIVQTFNPDHPALLYAKNQDFLGFFNYEIEERKVEHMPPHTYLLQLTTGYVGQNSAKTAAQKLKNQLQMQYKNIFVRGPAPAFHEHRGKLHYQQLTVSSSRRSDLVEIARNLPQRWQFTLDPINLL